MSLYRKLIAPFVRAEARYIYWKLRRDCDLVDRKMNRINQDIEWWKHQTTMNHDALVEDHLRTKAYFIAEKDGFQKDAAEYWEEAKRS